MGEDNCTDGCQKTRIALGDLTNQLGKRRFSMISDGSGEGFLEITVKKVRNKSTLVNGEDGVKKACISPWHCSEIGSLKGNVISGISKFLGENKEPGGKAVAQDELKDAASKVKDPVIILDLIEYDDVFKDAVQDGDELRENNVSGVSKGSSETRELIVEFSSGADDTRTTRKAGGELGDHCVAAVSMHHNVPAKKYGYVKKKGDIDEVIVSSENAHSESDVYQDEGNFHGGDDIVMSQTRSIDHGGVPLSQESRCFGLERCTTLSGDTCSNIGAAIDMIKACTCSFCTKAAYIWTDLHYQDIKGRIAIIKKSEKEASVLVERNCRSTGTEKLGPQGSIEISSLESELAGQWRSLFAQTERFFEREGSHLEASLLSLKELREKCKADLELL